VKTKNIMAVLCVSALAIPAGVAAKGPSGNHGKSGDQQGANQKTKTKTKINKRCKHQPNVGFSLHGTLNSGSNVDSIVVDVTSANKHSKPWLTPAPSGSNLKGTYSVPSGSNVVYQGANPFTTSGANLSLYKVGVTGKVLKLKKGCTTNNSPSPTVKRVKITAPDSGEQSGSNVEASGSNLHS
jgi:hypothetical protein